jgi:hypothetical protein
MTDEQFAILKMVASLENWKYVYPDEFDEVDQEALEAGRQAIEQAQKQERNFCPRCGKRLGKNDWDIHTCTPPAEQAQKQPDLDAICQDLQEKTYAQAMRIAELEQAQKEKQHGAD